MKIRLSEDEVYEIKMPEEIGIEEFQGIVTKFNFLSKNFVKFNIGGTEQKEDGFVLPKSVLKEQKKHDKGRWIPLRDDRNLFTEILKAHYLKSTDEFYEIISKYNLNLQKSDMCSPKIIRLKEMHKLEPNEVGLIKFPTKKEQVCTLILGENENE